MSIILFFATVTIALFAILNPIGAVPTLVSLTQNYSTKEKDGVIRKSVLVASGMIIGFMLIGVYIFSVLGIDISDFKIAGGILLFKVAFDMLQGKTSNTKLTPAETEESQEKEAIGIVPIGSPLLAGPGTITTAIIYFNSLSVSIPEKGSVFLSVVIVMVATYYILKFSTKIFDRVGKTGSLIISRIMGLLLAAIAVSFVISGIAFIVTSSGLF
ncbi:MAG: MarC family protein [Thermoplasmataceae archaeon]